MAGLSAGASQLRWFDIWKGWPKYDLIEQAPSFDTEEMEVVSDPGPGALPLGTGKILIGSPARQAGELALKVVELERRLAVAEEGNEAHRLILDAAGEGIYGLDIEGRTTFANPAACRMTGWEDGELIGKPQHATIHHSHADGTAYARELCPIYMALRDGKVHSSESEVFWRRDGTSFPVAYTSTPILLEGQPSGAVVIFKDITARKQREEWEKKKAAVMLSILNGAPLAATLGILTEAFRTLNQAWGIAIYLRVAETLGLVVEGGTSWGLSHGLAPLADEESKAAWTRALDTGKEVLVPSLYDGNGAKGESHQSVTRIVPLISSSGQVLGAVGFLLEYAEAGRQGDSHTWMISSAICEWARLAIEHQQLQSELVHQSQHDHLTGLPNRLLLEDRLKQAIARAKRQGTILALCYLDLDEFKQVNDTLGHTAGDMLLRRVANALRDNLREIDTVARQGGDEFILLLPDLASEQEAEEACERVLECLRQPFRIDDQTIVATASMGMSFYPTSAETPGGLLQHADVALYSAKRAGRDRVRSFDQHLGEQMKRQVAIERELRFALERDQLRVDYQPLYGAGMRLEGFEALLRWNHPALGPVAPDEFIPVAEHTGFIVPIGEWVLKEACVRAREWNQGVSSPVRIFVNTSGVQLSHPGFLEAVSGIIGSAGIDPALIELEITETWIVADPEAAAETLRALRHLGLRIAIDDFGSGHASFAYLQQLPVDTVKIDRAFISCLDGTAKQSAIVRAVVALASEIGLRTVAEGIETSPQLRELLETDCSLFQGFLFSKPLRSGEARLLLSGTSAGDGVPQMVSPEEEGCLRG